ncbi:MAG: Holliday junction ATP-dependent DNA helicase RuvA [candidate division TM6 bacterium GW2011_GWF2_38_10]|nr:MAG: Holliday junction ATP-dependent DNA helicase RuvA [candidate division TM6 bacterium GW2011_GWF2_38_10]
MIDVLIGRVKNIREKTITIMVAGVGFSVAVARPSDFVVDQDVQVYTHLHWNAEHGFSLLGFATELERSVFLMIIDCPKIGPSIGLSILSSVSAGEFLKLIHAQNTKGLSALQGIGPKKAEQLIVALKHKVSKLLSSGILSGDEQASCIEWHEVSEVLTSLNYSKPEISQAMLYLSAKYAQQDVALDVLIRSALAFLSARTV